MRPHQSYRASRKADAKNQHLLCHVVVDSESKTIFINDLKPTSKAIQDFPETVEYYKYWMQAVIYTIHANNRYLANREDKLDRKFQVTFIVIDKYNLVYPFQVSQETLEKWKESFNEIVKTVKWHYENRRYDLPYSLVINNVKL
jgi:hypothetical protein